MQIISDQGFGEKFGTGLGAGLSGGLEELANLKLKQLKERHEAKAFESMGLPGALALLDPKVAAQFVKQQTAAQQAQRGGELANQLQNQLAGLIQPQQASNKPTLEQFLSQQQAPQQPQMQQEPKVSGLDAVAQLGMLPGMEQMQQLAPELQQLQQQQEAAPQEAQMEQLRELVESRPTVEQAKKMSYADKLALVNRYAAAGMPADQVKLALNQIKEEEAQKRHEEKVSNEEQAKIDKKTQPYVNDLMKAHKGAERMDLRMNKMEKLIKEGSLPISKFYNLWNDMADTEAFKGLPFGLGSIPNVIANGVGKLGQAIQRGVTSSAKDIEQYEKLVADFLKDIKDVFPGGKITNLEIEAFMKTIPTLSVSDAGKLAIINNVRTLNKMSNALYKSYEQIIKENNGKRPDNIEFLVQERARPELDEIESEFLKV